MTQSSRQNAETIAREVRVFVRKARAQGANNYITTDLIWERATVLGFGPDDFSLRTVKAALLKDACLMGETHLIGF